MAQKSIQSIVLTNYKKHAALALQINGNSFILCGGNGAGKSSILQAIDHMIANSELADDAITEGEEAGSIELLCAANGDTYKVVRRFTKKGLGRYELRKDAGNGRFDMLTPAQERFAEIFGNVLDLSPLMDMSGKEQLAYIQQVVGKDGAATDFISETKKRVEELRTERLLCGRLLKDLKAKMNDGDFRELVNYIDEPLFDLELLEAKYVDVSELYKQKSAADLRNSYADEQISKLQSIRVKDADIEAAIQNVVDLLVSKKIDTSDIEAQIANADEINAAVDAEMTEANLRNAKIKRSEQYLQVNREIQDREAEYASYTAQIAAALGGINNGLSKMGFGEIYEGLSLEFEMDENGSIIKEGLFLRGMPFNRRQQSEGEMTKVLVMLSKAFNPDGFNYVKIGNWNELDAANQEMIIKLAHENDIQLGIEKVDNNKEIELQLIER